MKNSRLLFLLCLSIPAIHTAGLALTPERHYKVRPYEYGIIYEDVTFTTRDSVAIKGWFFPAQDTANINNTYVGHFPLPESIKRKPQSYRRPDTLRHTTIVIPVGDAGNMSYTIFHAYNLFKRGFNVLLFDWRGFGESADWPIDKDELSYTEFLLDYDAAIDYVKTRPEVDTTKIGVFGYSTGAYLSFAVTAKRSDVRAFAGRGIISTFDDVIPVLNKLLPEKSALHRPRDYPKDLEPLHAASAIKAAVLLIVGEKDARTPAWMSQKVYDKLTGSKELWIVPNAEHGGANAPEYINYPEFFVRLASFYRDHL